MPFAASVTRDRDKLAHVMARSGEALTYGDPVSLRSFMGRVAYGVGWAGAMLSVAAVIFTRKDVR